MTPREWKKQVTCSMAIENVKLRPSEFKQWNQPKRQKKKACRRRRRRRRHADKIGYEKKQSGHERSPSSLSIAQAYHLPRVATL